MGHPLNFNVEPKEESISVRLEKFKFMEKGQNRNFDYEIVISVKKIHNLFSRYQIMKRISPLESSREI